MAATNIGLVGCGRWGKLILRDLKLLGCAVTVIANSTEARANANEGGADLILSSLEELVEQTSLEGIIVATPTPTHYAVLRRLMGLRPGLPLFCEKPVTDSFQDARELFRLQPEHIFVMDKWRYHAGVLKLAEIAHERSLGAVLGIRTERLGWGMPHPGANVVWHLMPHDMAIVLEILGFIPELRTSHLEWMEEQCFGAVATFGDSPWVECEVSAHWPIRTRRIQLVCKEGVAFLEDGYSNIIRIANGSLTSGDIQPTQREFPFELTMPLFLELQAFVKFIKSEGPPPKSSLRDALKIVEAIEQTIEMGKRGVD